MRQKHDVKTWPAIFEEFRTGRKTFDVRKNDRNYKVGDTIIQHEYYPTKGTFTGRNIEQVITYILEGDKFGVVAGFVAMSVKPIV